jgi:nucleotide-binding universal stress UspA family protein
MKILLAYDGSAEARRALDWAAKLARPFADSLVIVLTVSRSLEAAPPIADAVDPATSFETERTHLDEAATQLESAGVKTQRLFKVGSPAEQILDASDEQGVDVIVVGNRGSHAAQRFLMGSVSDRVARHSSRPVLIVR